MYAKVGHPPICDNNTMVRSKFLIKYVEKYEEIYGHMIMVLKDRMVRANLNHINTDYIQVSLWLLNVNQNVILYGDIRFI